MENINFLSYGIQGLISLIIFYLGTLAGKKQTDRPRLKKQYQTINAHLSKIERNLKTNDPLDWYNDKENTLLEDMIDKGENHELNKSVFNKCLEAERLCIAHGKLYQQFRKTFKDTILKVLDEENIAVLDESHKTMQGSFPLFKTNIVEARDPQLSDNPIPFYKFKSEAFINIQLQELINNNRTFSIVDIEGTFRAYTIKFRSVDFPYIEWTNVLTKINEELNSNKVINAEISAKKELVSAKKRLEKRIKEPFSFPDTVKNLINDKINKR